MTNRHVGYIVTLDEEVREDEDSGIITAISMVKGVISVKPLVKDWEYHTALQKARHEIRMKLWKALE